MTRLRWFILSLCATVLCLYWAEAIASQSAGAAPVVAERPIPFKSSDETSTGAIVFRVVAGLGVVLVVGIVVLAALRKFVPMVSTIAPHGSPRVIELIELRRLTPRLTIILVEVQGSRYLLAQSGDRLIPLVPSPAKN